MNIYDLISRAQKLRQETKLDSVSPDRVGALCEDTLKYINEFQLLASSPSLHKIYASVSAMQADKSPQSDLTGKALKLGQLVVIVPANQSDATAGDVYRYDGPSGNTSAWTFVAKIGAVPADAVLNATSANPVQNKVVTEKLTELSAEMGKVPSATLYEKGSIGIHGEDETSEVYVRSNFIACHKGDVVSGKIDRIVIYDAMYKKIATEMVASTSHTIATENCAYIRLVSTTVKASAVTINNVDANHLTIKSLWTNSAALQKDVMNIEGWEIPFNVKGWNPYRFKPIIKKGSTISISANVDIALLYLMRASDESLFSIRKEQLPYTTTEDIKGMQTTVDAEGILSVKGVIDEKIKNALVNYTPSSGDADSSLNALSYIAMPIPQLAVVNIVANNLPTTKVDDIKAVLEFDGRNGNIFKKNIIINAQGNSSLAQAKKNFSIDIMDENYDDSHKIKFGNWVAQDGFHLKSYVLDGIRVKAMAAYDIYESIILHNRTIRSNRVWKRCQLPNIPITGNTIEDVELQLDGGAKGHPSGFPVIVNFNGEFYGIYCWQLKKHRDNYHQKKSVAEHIHLDGVISENLLWNVNGNIDWDRWSGKKAETDGGTNYEGAEIRNPKKLILVDGTEYDGDTNRGELIATTSPNYDATNEDMIRTASVRASIESLSRRVYSLNQMSKGAEKKAEIAKVFDVDSIIDYIIFGQLVNNWDGYRKNWQWTTHDGIKWAVNAYDLDSIWGWTSWGVSSPSDTWIRQECPPIGLIIENYLDEMKARYAELRSSKVVSVEKMMQPLVQYVQAIGVDYYEQEYEKWEAEGVRDNLWRFEVWMEESINRTDALMGYNS